MTGHWERQWYLGKAAWQPSSMDDVRTIDDVPSDVLFKILQHLSTEDIYNLGRLEVVSKSFRASVMQVEAKSWMNSMCVGNSGTTQGSRCEFFCRYIQHSKYLTCGTAISTGSGPVTSAAK